MIVVADRLLLNPKVNPSSVTVHYYQHAYLIVTKQRRKK